MSTDYEQGFIEGQIWARENLARQKIETSHLKGISPIIVDGFISGAQYIKEKIHDYNPRQGFNSYIEAGRPFSLKPQPTTKDENNG